MNYFDRFLELKLRQMLDPVVVRRPPSRRGRLSRPQKPILAVIELSAEVIPAVEPAVVTVPVAAAPLL